jgi:O-antigen ligase
MAIVELRWMPRQVFEIPGLNPWNLLLVVTVAAFIFSSRPARPQLATVWKILLVNYLVVLFIAFFREYGDLGELNRFGSAFGKAPLANKDIILDDLLNPIKYVAPAFLIYMGCDSEAKLREAVLAVLAMNVILALLVLKSLGLSGFANAMELNDTAVRRIDRDVGYFRSDLAILFAGGSWAIYAFRDVVRTRTAKFFSILFSGICAVAIGLSGGRMGMFAWGGIAAFLGTYKSRKILVIGALALTVILLAFPAIQQRLLQGIVYDESDPHNIYLEEGSDVNVASMTSRRTVIWPHVIDKISEAPLFGYGRRAMQRTGLSLFLAENFNAPFPHPHNAYLQLLLDNGLILGIPVLLFYFLIFQECFRLSRLKQEPEIAFVGTFGLVFVMGFLLGGVAQQSFYPMTSSVSMWVSIALVLRVSSEMRQRLPKPAAAP